ncbi:hypothetical protein KEM48_011383 [Puccinia striiformis f. sp. tritici PST-130]|nr:hypothetical protein KEM48_011383 [Puccinia striiformis f. sp. tritici PST-130]
MSDLDNELLALAGGDSSHADPNPSNSEAAHHGATKRSKKSHTLPAKMKRRKTMEMDTESDMEMSSGSETGIAKEEDEDGPSRVTSSNLYPYEGIYKDAADKQQIQSMSELDREAILGDRQDEIQKIRDRENIKNMVRAKDEASGKRYSARDKSRIGVTSEKAQKLDELKQRRQAKENVPSSMMLIQLNRGENGIIWIVNLKMVKLISMKNKQWLGANAPIRI